MKHHPFTNDGATIKSDANAMRDSFSVAGAVVLTSSSGDEDSIEDPKWKHGAFTEALLEELSGDSTSNGVRTVSIAELANDLAKKLQALTNGAQHLGVSPNFGYFGSRIFTIGQ